MLGPWPLYLLTEVAIVLIVWALMTWPWERMRSSHRFRCPDLLSQCGQRTSQQSRHVHLRYPEPFGDLRLRHVLEEPKLQNRLVAFRQRRQEWTDRFDVEHLVQIGVQISEGRL